MEKKALGKKAGSKQTNPSAKTKRLCSNCGRGGATAQCIHCKLALYCNRTCQKQHWKTSHKEQCKALAHAKSAAVVEPQSNSTGAVPRPQAPGPRSGDGERGLAHPCPICLVHEDDFVDKQNEYDMCTECGQMICGECMGAPGLTLKSLAVRLRLKLDGCPACHRPFFPETNAEIFHGLQKLLNSKPPGRHTPSAQFHLGGYYLKGDGESGVCKDEAEAARLFKLAADKGHKLAQNNAAMCYSTGIGVPKDDLEAVRLFKLAATQGDFAACYSMSNCCLQGLGVQQDINEAARWLRLTVAANPTYDISKGEELLGTHLTKGFEVRVEVVGLTSAENCALNGRSGTLAPDHRAATSMARNNSSKQVFLDGDDPGCDQPTTIRCMNLKLLADQPRDPQEAYMTRPAAATPPAALLTDAPRGPSSSGRPHEMCMTCQAVVEESDPSADWPAGYMCYSCGRFLCSSCSSGKDENCPTCQEPLNEQDSAKMVKQLKRLLLMRENGSDESHRCCAIAQNDLGCYYRDGIGVKQNYEEAVRRFHLSTDHGYARADFDLGQMYRTGRGVPTDHKEASRWYKAGALKGNLDAQVMLGSYHMNGYDNDPMANCSRGGRSDSELADDYKEARRLFTLAATRNHANAHNMIARMEYAGCGVPRSVNGATKWCRLGLDANRTKDSLTNVAAMGETLKSVHFLEGTCVEIVGLKTPAGRLLNGSVGKVMAHAQHLKPGRVAVRIQHQPQPHSVRCINLNLSPSQRSSMAADINPPPPQAAAAPAAAASSHLGKPVSSGTTGFVASGAAAADDPEHPCPICLENEDDTGDWGWCPSCGQLYCYKCKSALTVRCPTCRAPAPVSDEARFTRTLQLLNERSPGRHTTFAQVNLGCCYRDGVGTTQSRQEAIRWLGLAADSGDATAQCHLGKIYSVGHYSIVFEYQEGRRRRIRNKVPPDFQEAMKWFTLAASGGCAEAQHSIACAYLNGHGVIQDFSEAMRWGSAALNSDPGIDLAVIEAAFLDVLAIGTRVEIVGFTDFSEAGVTDKEVNIAVRNTVNLVRGLRGRIVPPSDHHGQVFETDHRRAMTMVQIDDGRPFGMMIFPLPCRCLKLL